MLADCIL